MNVDQVAQELREEVEKAFLFIAKMDYAFCGLDVGTDTFTAPYIDILYANPSIERTIRVGYAIDRTGRGLRHEVLILIIRNKVAGLSVDDYIDRNLPGQAPGLLVRPAAASFREKIRPALNLYASVLSGPLRSVIEGKSWLPEYEIHMS
jgi:hypothetical protein